MNKKLIITFIAGILVSLILFYGISFLYSRTPKVSLTTPTNPVSTNESNDFSGQLVLIRGKSQETGVRIPYDVTGAYPGTSVMILSPDKKQIVYTLLENTKITLYVSNIDGTNSKKIAEQEVSEGSGALDTGTIQWSSDGKNIIYIEHSQKCIGKCVSPNDEVSVRTQYSIDVQSGNKTVVQTQ